MMLQELQRQSNPSGHRLPLSRPSASQWHGASSKSHQRAGFDSPWSAGLFTDHTKHGRGSANRAERGPPCRVSRADGSPAQTCVWCRGDRAGGTYFRYCSVFSGRCPASGSGTGMFRTLRTQNLERQQIFIKNHDSYRYLYESRGDNIANIT